jgi:DNA polymerase
MNPDDGGAGKIEAFDPETLAVTACTRCDALVESRSQIVNGVGPREADLVFVGEGPGAQEDAQGEPFVGRSGDVLDAALADAGVDRDQVRITNCVRCRPPENRDPHQAELENCRDYLHGEIATIDPALVVTLGKVPSEHLLRRDVGVTAEAGDIVGAEIAGEGRPVLVCVHPAATLYDRSQETVFESTIATAADYVSDEGGQARLGEY